MATSFTPQLLAGTAAVVAAAAVTVAGVAPVLPGPPATQSPALADLGRAGAETVAESVALAAFASPLLEIYDTIQKTNLYLFSIAEPPVTTFDRAGIIPDLLAGGFPIVTQYFLNAPDYVSQAINYMFAEFEQGIAPTPSVYPGALRLLTWAADALPANLIFAGQQLISGNLVGSLQTLQFATINPVQAALYQTLNAGLYALGGVAVRTGAVINAIAEWVPTTVRNLADDVTVVLNAAVNVIGNVAYGLQTLNLETVWNSLVVGLLGSVTNPVTPTIPDALINQTIGEGGRIYTTPGQPGYLEIPSVRQNLTDLRDNIADALATTVPAPEAPPFPVTFFPYGSQIPTPWNPTPRPRAAAAVPPAQAVTVTADTPGLEVAAAGADATDATAGVARAERSEPGIAGKSADRRVGKAGARSASR